MAKERLATVPLYCLATVNNELRRNIRKFVSCHVMSASKRETKRRRTRPTS